ncbi:MAG: hypothetical protein AB8C84_04610 [Oligoflexales bacterium]
MLQILFSLFILGAQSPPLPYPVQTPISPTLHKNWNSKSVKYANLNQSHQSFIPPQAITGLW